MTAILLQDQALQEIFELGLRRVPSEACGFLLPKPYHDSWIVEMPNRSMHPHNSFEFNASDVRIALGNWLNEATVEEAEEVTLWHTHPSGGIGPSRIDMHNKIEGAHHLVVTITEEGPVPSWY